MPTLKRWDKSSQTWSYIQLSEADANLLLRISNVEEELEATLANVQDNPAIGALEADVQELQAETDALYDEEGMLLSVSAILDQVMANQENIGILQVNKTEKEGDHQGTWDGNLSTDFALAFEEEDIRMNTNMGLGVEVRLSDPTNPQVGQIWLRSDL